MRKSGTSTGREERAARQTAATPVNLPPGRASHSRRLRYLLGGLASLVLAGGSQLLLAATDQSPSPAAEAKVEHDAHESAAMAAAGAPGAGQIDFNRDIRPILNDKCFHCHGPDEKSRKAKLRLDDRDSVLKKEALVPGDPAASELIRRIASQDEDDVMPPTETHQKVTPDEIQKLKKWVAQGAKYSGHWAFTNPVLPPVPAAPSGARVSNPIDAFIATDLAKAGLHQSAPADKGILLRRASLDLTGIPPTPEQVQAFLADNAPDAYERAVDRLLASKEFGPRWARMWLDLARYADSTGYGMDVLRPYMWPYRDWVVQAFNENKPFDQFTIEQLAGDLLPDASTDQKVATAFHRNTPANMEGGTQDEEYRVAAVKDRTATTIQVWMGLTMGCAQCHTHKFDPITINDYYSVYSIFNQSEDADLKDESPRLAVKVDPSLMSIEKSRLEARLKALQSSLKKAKDKRSAEVAAKKTEKANPETASSSGGGAGGVVATADAAEPSGATTTGGAATTDGKAAAGGDAGQASAEPTVDLPVTKLNQQIKSIQDQLAAVATIQLPIMQDLPADKHRDNHILIKGNYLAPGDAVRPHVLASFGTQPPDGSTRLDLARWLLDDQNPLTARVTVNRFWAQLFGLGIVETQEDFGTQGSLPTHPELLDWLAVTFRTPKDQGGLGWDMKALLRLMVTSQTYRQTSAVNKESVDSDPRNLLLSYYPRRRLDAEGLRDQALALGGLLSEKVGGPSVFPPQPDGLWQVSFNGGSKSEYVLSKGEDRYRRGIYTIWRRIAPPPAMTTLDAPPRDVCSIRRIPTNTPLQAFVMLNDPQFYEAAQGLGRRILAEGGSTAEQRLNYGLELVTARPASEADISVLRQAYEAELAAFQKDPERATRAATDPIGPLPPNVDPAEAAAMTSVATVLLNLDAVLTKN